MEVIEIDKHMYNMSAGNYSGVIMPEEVMKKILKLQYEYQCQIRKCLNKYKEDIYASHWTMEQGEENPIYIKYVISGEDVEHRISLFKPQQPEYLKHVYIVKTHEEAEKLVKKLGREK